MREIIVNCQCWLYKRYQHGSLGKSEKSRYDIKKMVSTNIGMIPAEDYLEIVSGQYGFDSYEDLKKAGYDIDI